MGFTFPKVKQSRIERWKTPQYTRKGMLLFTLFFGFFGLHHFYMRSPQTGLLLFLTNLFTFGYGYFFDIVQLYTLKEEDLNQYGLSLPWGPAGIAQGMWKLPDEKENPDAKGPPDPLYFLGYVLFLPFLAPLAQVIAGDLGNTGAYILTFFAMFIFGLGILIYIFQVGNELGRLFLYPEELFDKGIQRTFPYTTFASWGLGLDKEGHAPNLTGKEEGDECENVLLRILKMGITIALPILRNVVPAPLLEGLEEAVQTGKKVVETGKVVAETVIKQGPAVVALAQGIDGPAQMALHSAKGKITSELGQLAPLPSGPLPPSPSSLSQQQGGGTTTWKDKAIMGSLAALTAGGFLLTAGRSTLNVLQNAYAPGPSDSPP